MAEKLKIDLSGKRALVTGAAGAIGSSICRTLARCGSDVVVNDVRAEEAAAFAASLAEEFHIDSVAVPADVGRADEVADMFDQVRQSGELNILVNNAGWEDCHHAIDLPEASFDRAVDTNLKGPLLCSQQAARLMRHGGGTIVNILSIHDSVPRKGGVHYCAAKAGLLMLTKALAMEWSEYAIRVNGVSPGAIMNEGNRAVAGTPLHSKMLASIGMGRIGEPDEIAHIVCFLASDLASYVTGSTIYADGGYRLSTIPYDHRPNRQIE